MAQKTSPMCLFFRNQRGVTAVEFALLAPVLLYVFMGIVEVSLMFFAAANLDGAAINAARKIRTGQAQESGDAQSTFSTELCSGLHMFSCGDIFYDVRIVASFSDVSFGIDLDPDTDEPETYGFDAGGASDIVVVRAMAYWEFNTPLIGNFFENTGVDNKRLLVSVVTFQSEPYE